MLAFYLAQFETADDKEYFRQIYEEYHNKLHNIAQSILHSSFLADEAVHDTFIKVIVNFEKFRDLDKKAQEGWLTVVTSNIAKNINRKEMRSIPVGDEALFIMNQEPVDYETYNLLVEEINKLPEKYRVVLEMHYLLGYKIEEIAHILELTTDNVKKRLSRGRIMIRNSVDRSCGGH